ncbi:MAG: DEAD/DEAH box helicase [Lamprobacter sp.]|uniref:DEAD/DEAH box helicase n=1 Tax=Lamprobacter sp. TaxID=3100796 RepID=UPI002B25766F|nr:DEAD/DEAH box helicase [Lamprobacter sp.]MEA3639180.1 DEAD/DEAH box helicase [Lamprobacter sp.]
MSFDNLGLSAELLRAVREQGYTQPTPIQTKAIPTILSGGDVMAAAQTGTGKTAGFTLPLLQRLSTGTSRHSTSAEGVVADGATQRAASGRPHGQAGKQPARQTAGPSHGRAAATNRPIRALVLTPTRELAAQVQESIQTYGQYLPLRSTVIFGGVKINPQIDQLRRGVDILVATPGRLLDHAGQGTVDLSQVETLILDEADRMLDMGFIHDIKKVLALLPPNHARQNLLFSATFSDDIKRLAERLLNNPELIEAAPRNTTAERINQVVYPVDRHRKRELLSHMIGANDWRQVLVFTRTKHGANRLAEQLETDGLSAAAIHGNKSQGARTRALAGFKSGDVRVLVATDIAARGLDIDQLPHVVNYELPNVPEDYVHRIGRTGRAGREGQAVSLVCVDEHRLLRDIERLLKREVPKIIQPGYDPDPSIPAEPIKNGRSGPRPSPAGGRRGEGRNTAAAPGQRPRRAGAGNGNGNGRADERRSQGGRSVASDGGRGATNGNHHRADGQAGRRSAGVQTGQTAQRAADTTRDSAGTPPRPGSAAAKRGHGRRQGADTSRPSNHRHPRRGRSQETAALLGGRDD